MTRRRLAASTLAAVLGAALLIAAAPVRARGENVLSFTADVTTVDPCTGEDVSGSLDVLLVANRVSTGNGGIHVTLHGNVHGQLVGNLGTTYQLSAEGTDHFDSVSGHYDFAFHMEGISRGSGSNLTLDGVARLFVNADGNPTGGTIVTVSPTCR